MAVLIAAILALTFEEISKVEFQELQRKWKEEFQSLAEAQRKAVTKDVFVAVFGAHIPEKIRSEIIQQIFWSKLTRKAVEVTYTLREIPGHPDFVLVQVDASFELHNTSLEAVPLPLRLGIDRAPVRELEEHVKLLRLAVTGCEPPLSFRDEDLVMEAHGEHMEFNLEKTGRAAQVVTSAPAVVAACFQSVEEVRHGHREIDFIHHVCDMKLALKAEGRLAGRLKVTASVTAGRLDEVDRDEARGVYRWRLARPLLPGQGLDVKWRLKDPAVAIDITDVKLPETEPISSAG